MQIFIDSAKRDAQSDCQGVKLLANGIAGAIGKKLTSDTVGATVEKSEKQICQRTFLDRIVEIANFINHALCTGYLYAKAESADANTPKYLQKLKLALGELKKLEVLDNTKCASDNAANTFVGKLIADSISRCTVLTTKVHPSEKQAAYIAFSDVVVKDILKITTGLRKTFLK